MVFGGAMSERDDRAHRSFGDLRLEYVGARREAVGALSATRAQERSQGKKIDVARRRRRGDSLLLYDIATDEEEGGGMSGEGGVCQF